jgi:signal peptide peptidase SppA
MHNLLRLLEAVQLAPWAIDPIRGQAIYDVLCRRGAGEILSDADIAALTTEAQETSVQPTRQDRVVILPIKGLISHRAESVQRVSGPGGTSTELLGQRFDAAMADESVGTIILDVNSPGGTTHGLYELAAKFRSGRESKRLVSIANAQAGSAAFWLASQATEFYATDSADVGSIGVYTMHQNMASKAEAEGVVNTLVSAGKYKTELNPFEPLSEEARAYLQARVDEAYDRFVSDVALGRGVSADEVKSKYGQGRTLSASKALEAGMIDGVKSLEQLVAEEVQALQQKDREGVQRRQRARRRRMAVL